MQSRTAKMEALYNRYSRRIFEYLYKYTGNEEIASDLMQDTFINFYKHYIDRDFAEERSLMVLYTIAKNNSINYSKKFSTQKEFSGEIDFYKTRQTPFETRQEWQDMEELLQEGLLSLPEDLRTVIILRNLEDMTLAQIATIMGLSISTISRLLIKATAHLIKIAESKDINPF